MIIIKNKLLLVNRFILNTAYVAIKMTIAPAVMPFQVDQ